VGFRFVEKLNAFKNCKHIFLLILGVNGAGKTTTFKMITGNEFFNDGDAFLNSISLKKNIKKVRKI
jgi:ABC-type multidrug transport system ATPase subunit